MKRLLLIFLLLLGPQMGLLAATNELGDIGVDDDDLSLSGDIFNDFNEELESSKITEDERYYAYGRFFSFQIGAGLTSFSGNRGIAYENDPPTFGLGMQYFMDFNSSFGLGVEYSRHHFLIDQPVNSYSSPLGNVEVNMLRTHFYYRYYFDTSNLGTAITYSNPYFTSRLEYWYTTNKFTDQSLMPNEKGGGLGFGLGGGLEFPIVLRETYLNIEFLYHTVNFFDKFTQKYAPKQSNYGYEDLSGDAYSTIVYFVLGW